MSRDHNCTKSKRSKKLSGSICKRAKAAGFFDALLTSEEIPDNANGIAQATMEYDYIKSAAAHAMEKTRQPQDNDYDDSFSTPQEKKNNQNSQNRHPQHTNSETEENQQSQIHSRAKLTDSSAKITEKKRKIKIDNFLSSIK